MKNASVIALLGFALLFNTAQSQTIKPINGYYPISKFTKSTTQTTHTNMLVAGQEQEMDMNMKLNTDVSVLSPETTKQVIDININSISGDIKMGTVSQPIPNISDSGSSFQLHVNKDGLISEMYGNTDLVKQMQQSGMNGYAINKPYSQFLQVKSEMKVGDSWTDSSFADNLMTSHYKFLSCENKIALLAVISDIKFIADIDQGGTTIHQNLVGTMTGTVRVNTENNLTIETLIDMKLEGAMEVNGMSIPLTLKGSVQEKVNN